MLNRFLSYLTKARSLILGLLAFVFWLSFSLVNLSQIFANLNRLPSELPDWMNPLLFSGFVISTIFFFRGQVDKARRLNLTDLLFRLFITGLVSAFIGILTYLIFWMLSDNRMGTSPLFLNILYDINLGVSVIFLISAFTIYKRLVLFQKTKTLLLVWALFEYGILLSLFGYFFEVKFLSINFNLAVVILGLLSLYLSANLKWIAYLSFKEKWKAILFFLGSALFLFLLFTLMNTFSNEFQPFQMNEGIFYVALINFVGLYGLFAFLVTVFNLPTTSVFEQKLREAMNIQMLSRSIQEQRSEKEIYSMYFNSSLSVVFADAAFMESIGPEGEHSPMLSENLNKEQILEIKRAAAYVESTVKGHPSGLILKALRTGPFRSLMMMPLVVRGEEVAILFLLKEVSDGFNDEMQTIITTFANQASISIENIRLINETVSTERYKKELKIARGVQRALLPQTLPVHPGFEVSAFSYAADEVGGDYYDFFMRNENLLSVVIADVSGKGTSAAFHMAQLKGIFQSLSELDLSPVTFMGLANSALSRSLDAKSFVTASYFLIDLKKLEIHHCRAGHCPTLIYDANKAEAQFTQARGLGLGLKRDADFEKYIQSDSITFNKGDILLLYTDGITEAKNRQGEELGYHLLKTWLEEMAHLDATEINDQLQQKLKNYCEGDMPKDDFTVVVMKFK